MIDHLAPKPRSAATRRRRRAAAARRRLRRRRRADRRRRRGHRPGRERHRRLAARRRRDAARPGDRVLATRTTYVSSALQLLELERAGVTVEVAPRRRRRRGSTSRRWSRRCAGPTALLAATHVPTSSGRVEPVAAIGALTAGRGRPLPARRDPVGRPPAGRRPGDRLRRAGHDRAQVPAGPARHRLPLRLARAARAAATDRPRRARRALVGRARVELADSARRFETWEAAHALRLGLGVALAEARATGIEGSPSHVAGLSACCARGWSRRSPARRSPTRPAGGRASSPSCRRRGAPGDPALASRGRVATRSSSPPRTGSGICRPRGLPASCARLLHVYNGERLDAVIDGARRLRAPAAPPRRGTPGAAPARAASASTPSSRGRRPRAGGRLEPGAARPVGAAAGARAARPRRGSSHGATRMIRRAYPSEAWDDLVDRAYLGWAGWRRRRASSSCFPPAACSRPRDAADPLRDPEVADPRAGSTRGSSGPTWCSAGDAAPGRRCSWCGAGGARDSRSWRGTSRSAAILGTCSGNGRITVPGEAVVLAVAVRDEAERGRTKKRVPTIVTLSAAKGAMSRWSPFAALRVTW